MQRLGEFFARVTQRTLPDPMVLACLLTLFVFALAMLFPQNAELTESGAWDRALQLSQVWIEAVWNPAFLTFALQMCVVLLTGYGLARAPLATRALKAVAALPRSNRGAVVLIALTSCVGCWINWGLGLILAGVLATEIRREMGRKGIACQYALIVAAAYAGMMIWHGGFSGSAPLKVASDGVVLSATTDTATPDRIEPLSIENTILKPANLVLTAVMFAVIPLLLRLMAVKRPDADAILENPHTAPNPPGDATRDQESERRRSLADLLNHSRLIAGLIALLIIVALGWQLKQSGVAAIGLNFVNSAFFALGLLFHGTLISYIQALLEGGRAIVGIVIQFPLYSGIQGLMFGAGLAVAISESFINASQSTAEFLGVSAAHTFPLATLLSAAVVNFFVPSGGGQWIVQGPIMCSAAMTLKVPIDQTVMAIAYGDQLTNMVQPFWAIPLMGLTQVNAREFMGYCALLMLLAIPFFAAALLLF